MVGLDEQFPLLFRKCKLNVGTRQSSDLHGSVCAVRPPEAVPGTLRIARYRNASLLFTRKAYTTASSDRDTAGLKSSVYTALGLLSKKAPQLFQKDLGTIENLFTALYQVPQI
jgi:hypothetical protein